VGGEGEGEAGATALQRLTGDQLVR